MTNQYIKIGERHIDFVSITEEDFFQSTEEMVFMAQEAEQVASHPLSNIYASNLRWALTSFNLFEFHTNFPISKQALETIEATSGIESIAQYTKYRGIISIGKLFDPDDVKKDIQSRLTSCFSKQNADMEAFVRLEDQEEV